MFSEISQVVQVVSAGLLASGLIAIPTALRVAANRPQAPNGGFVYNKPLFSCSQGATLYDRISKNENFPLTQRQELIQILMKDMPQNCN